MLVIFDCDGTLIDSEVIYSAVDAAGLTRLGHPVTPLEFLKRFLGVPHKDIWRILETEIGKPLPDGFLAELSEEAKRRTAEDLVAIEGVVEAIAAVDAMGLRRCVASSTPLDTLRRNLKTCALIDMFDPHVFSASQCARGKPSPDVFMFAASQMGADPKDCLVIEDSVAGVTAAGRAGMPVIGFVGGGHADDDLSRRLSGAGARQVIPAMADLGEVIAAHFGL